VVVQRRSKSEIAYIVITMTSVSGSVSVIFSPVSAVPILMAIPIVVMIAIACHANAIQRICFVETYIAIGSDRKKSASPGSEIMNPASEPRYIAEFPNSHIDAPRNRTPLIG